MRSQLPDTLFDMVIRMKKITDVPLAVGFGISTPEHVRMLSNKVEGVIIGSRFIKAILENEDLAGLVSQFKEATRISRSK